MPFGAVSAPGEYQIFIATVLSGLLGLSVTVYIDDILCFADTLNEIVKNVLNLLFALRSGPLCYSLSPADCTRLKLLKCPLTLRLYYPLIVDSWDGLQLIANLSCLERADQFLAGSDNLTIVLTAIKLTKFNSSDGARRIEANKILLR
jgi:hypothetical protein